MYSQLDYIFNHIMWADTTLQHMEKKLRFQKSINCNTAVFMTAMSIYVCLEVAENFKRRREIENLKKELKELRQAEGE